MYAIIKTGGKQYKVTEGMGLMVEKLKGESGSPVTFDNVLMVGGDGSPQIGTPVLSGALVSAEIIRQAKAKKVLIYKKNRRKGYEKKTGHRQQYTEVKISKINT